jgi:PAS domain S-box-containing protein
MSTPQILIVEDKAIIAKDIQATLEKAGYQVLGTASRGETAVRRAAKLQPDLILMDIRLKGKMDGIEASRRIREQHNIPIVFLTAHADEETLRRAVSTEPFGYVLKPFEPRELEVAIEVSLYKHSIEKKLINRERWLAATLESIGDAVLTTDPEGKIIYLNPIAQTLTGLTPGDVTGKHIDEVITIINEDTRTAVANPLKQALQTGTAVSVDAPVLLVLADGREIAIDDMATPIRDEDDNIIGGVVIFRDVQLTRRLEEQLRQSQKLEAVGQLAAGMAHNFNNMLTIINLYSSMVRQTLAANDPGKKRLGVIGETTERAADMIQHLLAFSRRQVVQPKLLRLNEEILKIHRILREVLPETIALTTSPLAVRDWVRIGSGQLEQVVMNLVLNARDAMPKGGQVIIETNNITLDQPLISLPTGVPAGEYVRLKVTDTGVGIPKEIIDHVFEPFFTTKEVGQGSGLGLSTCFGIVEQNYGRITIESEPGLGTTFQIYLPLHKPPSPLLDEVDEESILGGIETILVVEDDAQIREAICLGLRQYGYTVFDAENGTSALHLIEAQRDQTIHLLITDVVMPEMGGKPLANLLKLIFKRLKVLFISGYPDTGNIPPGTAFIAKPFTPQRLAQKVWELLSPESP